MVKADKDKITKIFLHKSKSKHAFDKIEFSDVPAYTVLLKAIENQAKAKAKESVLRN